MVDAKAELVGSLEALNEAVLAKLDGLGQHDLRRPLTPTGTNMLGLVKHLASVQAGYFGDVFARPWPEPLPWLGEGAAINDDMFATAAESSDWVTGFYRRSWQHATETFAVTGLGRCSGRVAARHVMVGRGNVCWCLCGSYPTSSSWNWPHSPCPTGIRRPIAPRGAWCTATPSTIPTVRSCSTPASAPTAI